GRLVWIPEARIWLMEHEVTQGEWRSVMGGNPSYFSKCGDRCPVERVSWTAATTFAERVTRLDDAFYRLPTEAEWEIAAGALVYAGSDRLDAVGWYAGNSGGSTHPVCEKVPTERGLCDLTGNVWEWTATPDGVSRVIRGGGWFDSARFAVRTNRLLNATGNKHAYLGFRLAIPDVPAPAATP
ncbi:MAG: formylglycine-generating enzyme family protein, partial [Deltaproteobacteria bacterium]|nr:formylglycine-generating enzyme family protein [Deltaproteobacteria bacterium]